MALKDYMLDDERIVARCSGSKWEWLATTDRVVRYTVLESGSRKQELFEDVGYNEVSSVSLLVDRNPVYRKIAIALLGVAVVFGIVAFEFSSTPLFGLSIFLGLGGIFLLIYGVARTQIKLYLRGDTVLSGSGWSLEAEEIPSEEVASFMCAVRERSN
jgi:hypothetical protein